VVVVQETLVIFLACLAWVDKVDRVKKRLKKEKA
jgi:hypothetical protein